ncbi:MAG TPA: hypothetical protein IGS40_03590 [Trichormus sp. M33_DOE_039]|nr:hypothetical protein [Trichormus sp. M33_DOE_039]
MYYAKYILDNSLIICADDTDYSSYEEKGMRCLVCGRDVHLKKGNHKKPHFAHHKAVDTSDLECPLRIIGFGQNWSSLTPQARGQRREIFHRYLSKIINNNYPDFEICINKINRKTHSLRLKCHTEESINYFRNNKKYIIHECRSYLLNDYDSKIILQKVVASEIIDYLCIPASETLLTKLIHYSMCVHCNSLSLNLKTAVYHINPADVCKKIKQIILEVDWLSAIAKKVDKNKNYPLPKEPASDANSLTIATYPLFSEDELKIAVSLFLSNEGEFSSLLSFGRFHDVKLYLQDLHIYLIIPTEESCIPSIIGLIKSLHIDKNDQKIIVFWKFVDYNCIKPQKIGVFQQSKLLDALQITIEEFLKNRFISNLPIHFIRVYIDIPYWGNNWGKDVDNTSTFINQEEKLAKKLDLFQDKNFISCPCCRNKLNIKHAIAHFRSIHAQPKSFINKRLYIY